MKKYSLFAFAALVIFLLIPGEFVRALSLPTATTAGTQWVFTTGADISVSVTDLGGASHVSATFDYGLTTAYGATIPGNGPINSPSLIWARIPLGRLTCGTLYHYRAHATNPAGTLTGGDATFTTNPCTTTTAARVTTDGVTVLGPTSATINGTITDTGGSPETARGFQYWPVGGTILDVFSFGSYGTGAYSKTLTGLSCGRAYEYRAMVANTVSFSIGSPSRTFTTDSCLMAPPTVSLTSATYTGTTATLVGRVDTLGIGTSGIPPTTLATSVEMNLVGGSAIASVPSSVTTAGDTFTATYPVTCGTTYSFTANASNINGSATSTARGFTTSVCTTPRVTTVSVTPTSSSATFNGDVTDAGGVDITTRGFSYSNTTTLTTIGLDAAIDSGVGLFSTGPYNFTITGLSCNTDYHFRAYAMNSVGTGIGSDMAFRTLPCTVVPPIVHAVRATVSGTTATLTGHLDSFGSGMSGVATSAHVEFNFGGTAVVSSTPTMSLLGDFTGTTSVACGNTYTFFANASSTGGAAVSDLTPISFSTAPCTVIPPTVSMMSATYTGTLATLQGKLDTLGVGTSGVPPTALATSVGMSLVGGGTIPTTPSSVTIAGSTFSATYTVTCGTLYSFIANASNSNGVATSAPRGFTTAACVLATPTVTTNSVYPGSVTATGAMLRGTLVAPGTGGTATFGFKYGTGTSYATTASLTTPISSYATGTPFSKSISGLTCGTTYNYKATATNTAGTTVDTGFQSFTTSACPGGPVVRTISATEVAPGDVKMYGNLDAVGTGATRAYPGIEYGTTTAYGSNLAVTMSAPGAYHVEDSSLDCDTTYHYRAIAENSVGLTATPGVDMTFHTSVCSRVMPPSVETRAATSLGTTTATLNGHLLSTGGASNTVYFQYGDHAYYLSTGGYNHDTTGTVISLSAPGDFHVNVSGLVCGTTYHFMAIADNTSWQRAGSDLTFVPPCALSLPTVTTDSSTVTGTSTATINGTLVSLGGAANASSRGFTYTNTTTGVTTSALTTGTYLTGGFSASLTGLTCATTYTYIAQATTSAGTGYGNPPPVKSFTTSACAAVSPTVVTNAATSLGTTTATLSGTMTVAGTTTAGISGGAPTAAGFDYELGTSGSFTTVTATGTFSTGTPFTFSFPSGTLTCGTTYNYKAHATNAAGTGTGSLVSFTTSACTSNPTVVTTVVTSVGQTSAVLNGRVTALGATSVTSVGFVNGTTGTSLPSLPSSTTVSVTSGALPYNFTKTYAAGALTCNTTYSYIANATNSAGLTTTATSSMQTFTTLPCNPSVVSVSAAMAGVSSANFVGNLTGTGGTGILNHVGFYYGPTLATITSHSIAASTPSGGTRTTTGAFSVTATGLPTTGTGTSASDPIRSAISCNTPWYMKAWAWNDGTGSGSPVMGDPISFCN